MPRFSDTYIDAMRWGVRRSTESKQKLDRKTDEGWFFNPKYKASGPQRGYKEYREDGEKTDKL